MQPNDRRGRRPGQLSYDVICQKTMRRIPADQARVEWNGLVVDKAVYWERHPHDKPFSVNLGEPVMPFKSPETEPRFIEPGDIDTSLL